jgi:hypothetical protein
MPPKNKRIRKTPNLRSALRDHQRAAANHQKLLQKYKSSLEDHIAALDHLTDTLAAINTDAVVDSCIQSAAPGSIYDDTYSLKNITGLQLRDLPPCLNSNLDLTGKYKFMTIDGNDTVATLKGNAHLRYVSCHGG